MLVISATKRHKRDLEILADRLGYRHGERPNISAMIRAIATGELQIVGSANGEGLLVENSNQETD